MKWLLILVLAAVVYADGPVNHAPVHDVHQATPGSDFEWYFHHEHNLLLVLYHPTDSCYYINMANPTYVDWLMLEEAALETQVMYEIKRHTGDAIKGTQLEAMRNQYHDLLADFHCINKHVYKIDLSELDSDTLENLGGGDD